MRERAFGMKFLRRTSAGSSCSSAANTSIARSIACVASGRPAPRNAAIGVVFVTHGAPRALDRRERVDAARHQAGQVREEGAEARVGAAVRPRSRAGTRATFPSRSRADRERQLLAAAVVERDHALASASPSSARAARVRRASQTTRISSTLSHLRAEAAADVRARPRGPAPGRGRASRRATRRSWCGVCVESQAVSRPSAPTSAAAERGSSGHGRHPLADERARDDDVAAVEELLVALRRAADARRRSCRRPGTAAPRPSAPRAGRRRPGSGS